MPKQPTERTSRRSAPYNLAISTAMPGQIYMPLVAPTPPDWQLSYDHVRPNMTPLQSVMDPLPPTPHDQQQQHSPYMPHHHQQQQHEQHYPQYHQQASQRHEPPPTPTFQQGQSLSWSADDDEVLVKARTMNLPWGAVHEKHFPNKTANACRKRYERLMVKRRGTDWDEDRTGRLAVAYKEMREQTWSPLAEQLGERWDHVERAVSDASSSALLMQLT